MKNNQPVTQNEVSLIGQDVIISKTSLKGIISYVNDDFIRISGFSKDELIGKNHNMVRHPDMPPAAFEDLWNTIKSSRTWTGIVKNRCKNGDFYWVDATVSPVLENGQINEYVSVRRMPTRDQISSATALYQDINNGQASLDISGWQKLMNVFGDMKSSWKIFAIVGMFLIPVILLITMLAAEKNEGIRSATNELSGITYIEPVRRLQQYMAEHRGMGNGYLSGNLSFETPLRNKRNKIRSILSEIDVINEKLGTRFATNEPWQTIKNDWRSIDRTFSSLKPAESFKLHTQLISKVMALMLKVGDKSGLILDPNIDSYYLMDLVVAKIPPLVEKLGVVRGKGSGIAARKKISAENASGLGVKLVVIKELVNSVDHAVKTVLTFNADLKASFERPRQEFAQHADHFINIIDTQLVNKRGDITISSSELFAAGTKAINAGFALYDLTIPSLTHLIQVRHEQDNFELKLAVGIPMIFAILAALLGFMVSRSLSIRLEGAIDVFKRIAGGEYQNQINNQYHDEVGNLLEQLKIMQTNLDYQVLHEKRLAIASTRIKTSLDNANVNVMVINTALNIIYLNASLMKLFTNREAVIKKQNDHLDIAHLAESQTPVSLFFNDQQMNDMSSLQNTKTITHDIGECQFEIIVSPVVDEHGEKIGYCLEWHDRTDEILIEKEVNSIVEKAANGDFSERVGMSDKTGFIAILSQGLNQLINSNDTVIRDALRVLGAIAKGNLNEKIENDYGGAYGQLKIDINMTVDKLTETIDGINDAAISVGNGAKEIALGTNDISQRIEQQASSLEETAASMEEMTSTVKQNAENAGQANQLAKNARDLAVGGGDVVDNAVKSMQEISASSNKIADIIGVIDEIAFQTNLLALNAAVEAARAGEQGRGFAVVAGEVRNLAQRSAEAAKEIKLLIHDSVSKIQVGTGLVNQSGEVLDNIVNAVKEVSDIVAEISAASQEQYSGIEQVNKAVIHMDEITQQNAAVVEESASASASLEEQAENLQALILFFELAAAMQVETTKQVSARQKYHVQKEEKTIAKPTIRNSDNTKIQALKIKNRHVDRSGTINDNKERKVALNRSIREGISTKPKPKLKSKSKSKSKSKIQSAENNVFHHDDEWEEF